MAQQYNDILSDIKKRKFSPLYLFEGDEFYFIDKLSDALEESVLTPEQKSFNLIITYGRDTNALDLVMAAKRYPMMSEYQLIIVKEAQNMNSFESLESYFENPTPSTILVFCYKGKKIDKRTKFWKTLSKKCVYFESVKLRDYELPKWITEFIRSKGKSIEDKVAQLIADYLGSDLGKVINEIEKMFVNIGNTHLITENHVEQNIGISKDYNAFELQNAIAKGDFNKSVQIANYLAGDIKNQHPLQVISILFAFFSKVRSYKDHEKVGDDYKIASLVGISPSFVKNYASAARKFSNDDLEKIFGLIKYYDLKIKGVDDTGTDPGHLLIEFVVKVFNCKNLSGY